ncbi:hypothetical protein R6Q57_026043 [Mikania cordata]
MSLITRDLLGNIHHSFKQSKLPADLKSSEQDYLPRCESAASINQASDQAVSKLQDLNQPPLNNVLDLDLKLVSMSASSSPPYTLGKVKFALERAEKEHTISCKKRSVSNVEDEAYAAGCPSCLLYVLISTKNPKCPRCNITVVPSFSSPTNMTKKPRINDDLNINI